MTYTCPRCKAATEARFYGPCDACRATLRSSMAVEARDASSEAFEPSMHVTPNAVALKDD